LQLKTVAWGFIGIIRDKNTVEPHQREKLRHVRRRIEDRETVAPVARRAIELDESGQTSRIDARDRMEIKRDAPELD
jgi:hypothetical protein